MQICNTLPVTSICTLHHCIAHTYEPGCSGMRCEHESAVAAPEFETVSALHSAT